MSQYLRKAFIERNTNETKILIELNLDGEGKVSSSTGVGFFDHMMDLFGRHAGLDLKINVKGDLWVDAHHTVEDTAICLGRAIKEALGDKRGINRYGHIILPMDETLMIVSLDLGGRGFLGLDAKFPSLRVGDMDTELVEEFLRSLAMNAEMNLHVKMLAGSNTHHIIEAIFKGLARSLRMAIARGDGNEIPSTKGIL